MDKQTNSKETFNLLIEDDIGILEIFNGSQNKIDQPAFVDLIALKSWIEINSLKALIIRGHGRHFSAGANRDTFYAKAIESQTMLQELEEGRKILDFVSMLSIPVVAEISGVCFGAGLEIALSCHIRVVSENVVLAFPESTLGLMPGFTGTIKLPKKIGKSKAIELILSGETISAENALEIGLVDYVLPKKGLHEFVIKLLKKMTDNRPLYVINAIMTSINNSEKMAANEAMLREAELFCSLAVRAGSNLIVTPQETA
jgi:enoyl-CoA hydratase/carnithine racemase